MPTAWKKKSAAASLSISASPIWTCPLPSGETLRLGFVDVPGHERFVRNMLAGVGGIDLVLLVIAADESIKPQTREHFDICRLLSVRRGIAVLTKSDLVDRETLDVVRLEVEEFLRNSFLDPAQSSDRRGQFADRRGPRRSEAGAGEGRAEIPARDSSALARLPIDRVFTMKGFGAVVTGTLISGTIRKEDEWKFFRPASECACVECRCTDSQRSKRSPASVPR